jgi:ketosteroid isomerase-like protein
MSEQQNLEAVRDVYAAFGRADLEGILASLDPQVSWRTPGSPDLPTGGLRRGIDEVREFFGLLLTTFDIQDFRPAEFLTQGDKVVVLRDKS